MPTNRNALIRYRTINGCLSTGRKYSINELLDAVNEALYEFCGPNTTVSERTLRDDIRVMRSSALGFNAPIAVKEGLYYYADPGYSLLDVLVAETQLMHDLLVLFRNLKSRGVDQPGMSDVVKKLEKAYNNSVRRGKGKEWEEFELLHDIRPGGLMTFGQTKKPPTYELTWGDVIKML